MRLWQRLRYLFPAYRDADEREMHELESLADMAGPRTQEFGKARTNGATPGAGRGWSSGPVTWHAARMLRRNPIFTSSRR
jgi:hypothetical protein